MFVCMLCVVLFVYVLFFTPTVSVLYRDHNRFADLIEKIRPTVRGSVLRSIICCPYERNANAKISDESISSNAEIRKLKTDRTAGLISDV